MGGYAILLRWRLKEGREQAFATAWEEVTRDLLGQNSRGSALFRAGDGTYCALARWPDRQARDAAHGDERTTGARAAMAEAIQESLPPIEMSELINLWTGTDPDV